MIHVRYREMRLGAAIHAVLNVTGVAGRVCVFVRAVLEPAEQVRSHLQPGGVYHQPSDRGPRCCGDVLRRSCVARVQLSCGR